MAFQYLRRPIRGGTIFGRKVGQVWLIEVSSLDLYLKGVRDAADRRFGPHVYQELALKAEVTKLVPLVSRENALAPDAEFQRDSDLDDETPGCQCRDKGASGDRNSR